MRSEFADPARSRCVDHDAPSPAATDSHSVEVSNASIRITQFYICAAGGTRAEG